MRERTGLLILAALIVGAVLLAAYAHQGRMREAGTAKEARDEKARAEGRAAALAADLEKAKAQEAGLQAQLKAAQGLGGEVKDKLDALQKELQKEAAARDQALQGLAGQVQAKLAELTAAVADLKTQLGAQGSGLVAKLDEALKAKEHAAQADAKAAGLETQLKEMDAAVAGLTAERDRLAKEAKKREAEAAALRAQLERQPAAPPAGRVAERPAPAVPVVTSVEHVEASSGLVVLAAGKKSGLEPGHVLWVTRDGRPVGKVKVVRVHDDLAGAEVTECEPGEAVQVSDRAATRADPRTADPPAPAPPEPEPRTAPGSGGPRPELPLGRAPPPPPPPAPSGGPKGK
ncbi:MAG: hypothetical protein HY721_28405 [Planctomycetes bacterium]|nr:hypothetical protein [Planctomycetota bacterium]